VCYGPDGGSIGPDRDRGKATDWLLTARRVRLPYEPDVLERGFASDRGSERMRAAVHAELEAEASRLFAEVIGELAPHRAAIESLAAVLLAADDQTLSGEELGSALRRALAGPS